MKGFPSEFLRFAGGVTYKLIALSILVALVLLLVNHWRTRRLESICTSLPPGMTRIEVANTVNLADFEIRPVEAADQIVLRKKPVIGLAWCFVEYKDGLVTEAKFVRE